MARRRTDKYTAAIVIFVVTILFNFLKNVHRCHQWERFFITTIPMAILFIIGCAVANQYDVIGISICLVSLIVYSIYWYQILSIKTARLNANLWQQRQWWWQLDGWQFEQEVANVFRINGYQAKVTKGSGDGGVDIILKRNGIISIVQCKHYQNPVPPEPIRALWGVKDDFGASEVILVASSGITEMGARFVQDKPNFRVLNLDDIIQLSQTQSISETEYNQFNSYNYKQPIQNNSEIKSTIQEEQTINSNYGQKVHNYGRKIDL